MPSQEAHHYVDNEGFQPLHIYHKRDSLKKDLAEKSGISLVIVPYWWDRTIARYTHLCSRLLNL